MKRLLLQQDIRRGKASELIVASTRAARETITWQNCQIFEEVEKDKT